jgi:Holliday junction DNA helicase RuvA
MIAQLTGNVIRIEANSVVLDVGGVGYRVNTPLSTLSRLPEEGEKTTLFTVMLVREDDISLYGFRTLEEQKLFMLLTSVTGIGPKLAISMLSVMEWGELCIAVSSNDQKSLLRIPGVGSKLAQRLCLELGDRLTEFMVAQKIERTPSQDAITNHALFEDIQEALVNLGYSRADSRRAAERVIQANPEKTNAGLFIREALKLLSGEGQGNLRH